MNIVNNDSLRRSLGIHRVKLVTTLLQQVLWCHAILHAQWYLPFHGQADRGEDCECLKKKLVTFEQLCWVSVFCAGCGRLEKMFHIKVSSFCFIPVFHGSEDGKHTKHALSRSSQLLWPKSWGNLISMAWGLKASDVQEIKQLCPWMPRAQDNSTIINWHTRPTGLIYGHISSMPMTVSCCTQAWLVAHWRGQ